MIESNLANAPKDLPKNYSNVLMFNVKEGEKMECKKVIKFFKMNMKAHLKMH